jgi:thiamine biosynthesis protein ThiS
MEIVINGETREVPASTSIGELLRLLELKEDRVAIELNRQIVRRDRWPGTALQHRDRLEIVQFVGGG